MGLQSQKIICKVNKMVVPGLESSMANETDCLSVDGAGECGSCCSCPSPRLLVFDRLRGSVRRIPDDLLSVENLPFVGDGFGEENRL